MLKIEPGDEIDFSEKNDVQDVCRQTWHMLGPLRLIDIVKNSTDEIDSSLQYGKSIDKYKNQISELKKDLKKLMNIDVKHDLLKDQINDI